MTIIGYATDITDRRQVEQALRNREAALKLALDAAHGHVELVPVDQCGDLLQSGASSLYSVRRRRGPLS